MILTGATPACRPADCTQPISKSCCSVKRASIAGTYYHSSIQLSSQAHTLLELVVNAVHREQRTTQCNLQCSALQQVFWPMMVVLTKLLLHDTEQNTQDCAGQKCAHCDLHRCSPVSSSSGKICQELVGACPPLSISKILTIVTSLDTDAQQGDMNSRPASSVTA